jgi:hypothetical protein
LCERASSRNGDESDDFGVASFMRDAAEIFDESAYARFLARAGIQSSHEAYAAFRREFEEAKPRRPKCC